MIFRRILWLLALFWIFLHLIPINLFAQQNFPNIIFILADDLGYSQLGCYGSNYYQTPRIDELAKEGIRFTNAYAACSVCSPTRASIMTGKYPARLHITNFIPGGETKKTELIRQPEWQKFLPLKDQILHVSL